MHRTKMTGFFFLASGLISLISRVYDFDWDVTPDKKIWTVTWTAVALLFVFLGVSLLRKKDA